MIQGEKYPCKKETRQRGEGGTVRSNAPKPTKEDQEGVVDLPQSFLKDTIKEKRGPRLGKLKGGETLKSFCAKTRSEGRLGKARGHGGGNRKNRVTKWAFANQKSGDRTADLTVFKCRTSQKIWGEVSERNAGSAGPRNAGGKMRD